MKNYFNTFYKKNVCAVIFFCFLSGFSQTTSDKLDMTDKTLSVPMVSDKAVSQPVSAFELSVETSPVALSVETIIPQDNKKQVSPVNPQNIITVPVQKIEELQPAQKPENKKAAKNN